MADGVVDTVTLSLSGQDLTLTLGRTNNLADISDTITLPSSGGTGDDAFDWATVGNTDTIPDAKIPDLRGKQDYLVGGTFDITDRQDS